jgi:PAT family beta-lactamase induction signal transducer AmpG
LKGALKRKLIVLLLGFASGLPLALTGGTFQAWLKDDGIDLQTIGFLSIITAPYTYKFLWAPLVDSTRPLGLGRRRGWILLTQLGLVAVLLIQSFFTPSGGLLLFAGLAFSLAVMSATQDIAIDAYRREILPDEELGSGAALSQLGYRLGMILSSGIALILADYMSWGSVYQLMAASLIIGMVTTLLSPEPLVEGVKLPKLSEFIEPFKEFFTRARWKELILLILIYKITDAFAMALLTPFLMEIGFSKAEIGSVLKVIGVASTIGGALVAGALMERMTLKQSLWIFGLAQLLANLSYAWLATVGHNFPVFVTSVIIENFGAGLGTAAYVAFLMAVTDKRFSGTQYALFTSIAALSRIAVQFPSGVVATSIGWPLYFLLSVALGIPAVIWVLLRYDRWGLGVKG